MIDDLKSNYPHIEFKSLQFSLPIFNRMTILDRAKTMIWEIKDDNKDNFIEALGMAIYIESEQTPCRMFLFLIICGNNQKFTMNCITHTNILLSMIRCKKSL